MPGSSHITYSDYFSVGNFSNMPTPLPGNPLDPTPTPAPADLEISDIQLLSHTPEQGKITVQWQSNIVPEKFVVQIWVGATGIEAYKIGGDGIEVDGNKNSLVINAEDLGGISGWYTPLIRGIDGDWVYGKTTEVSALISLPTSTPTVTPTPTITPTLTPTNVPVSLKPTAVVPPPTATPIVVLTPTATPKPVKIPASTLFRYDGNGYTGYGPVSGGQATNWLFQLNRKSNVFNQGDTVYGMIRINEVTANFRFRVITYRNGAEAYDWSGGWTNVGHGWPYAHHWMNWDNIWSGNWEFHIYVDVGNDWNKIEVLSFTVH